MAEVALDGECYDAAVSLAVSSGVNSSDALCVARLGRVPSGQDHNDTVRLMRKSCLDQASIFLGRLLAVKSKAQYSIARCTRTDAEAAVKRAERMLETVRTSSPREEDSGNLLRDRPDWRQVRPSWVD
jgi:hypothetical protein